MSRKRDLPEERLAFERTGIKPWNAIDADVSKWFNYGFDESEFKAYIVKESSARRAGSTRPIEFE